MKNQVSGLWSLVSGLRSPVAGHGRLISPEELRARDAAATREQDEFEARAKRVALWALIVLSGIVLAICLYFFVSDFLMPDAAESRTVSGHGSHFFGFDGWRTVSYGVPHPDLLAVPPAAFCIATTDHPRDGLDRAPRGANFF